MSSLIVYLFHEITDFQF